ncbi:MAG TPA: GPW/gp25 family protein [Methanotrichaceae archaeon]|nr:GPW/gp25 family protein [Methanotrichaceae archaeon]
MNIDYPFHFDGEGKTATVDDPGHIRDMIEQFLFTNPGERVNRPDFGSGLLQMVFAPNSPELAAALQFTVQSRLQLWLGDLIDINSVQISSEESALNAVIQYTLRRTGEVYVQSFERGAQ